MMPFSTIDHTADTGIHVWSGTLSGLFEEACRAMFSQITDVSRLTGGVRRELVVEGVDRTDLLINWLRELLFMWTGEGWLIKEATITDLIDTRLTARIWAQPFDPKRHQIYTDIKAVTYHNTEVAKTGDGWEVTVIFDV